MQVASHFNLIKNMLNSANNLSFHTTDQNVNSAIKVSKKHIATAIGY